MQIQTVPLIRDVGRKSGSPRCARKSRGPTKQVRATLASKLVVRNPRQRGAVQCLCALGRRVDEFLGRDQLVDQSHAQSLCGRNAVGGKKQMQRRGLAEETWQSLRTAPAG